MVLSALCFFATVAVALSVAAVAAAGAVLLADEGGDKAVDSGEESREDRPISGTKLTKVLQKNQYCSCYYSPRKLQISGA